MEDFLFTTSLLIIFAVKTERMFMEECLIALLDKGRGTVEVLFADSIIRLSLYFDKGTHAVQAYRPTCVFSLVECSTVLSLCRLISMRFTFLNI